MIRLVRIHIHVSPSKALPAQRSRGSLWSIVSTMLNAQINGSGQSTETNDSSSRGTSTMIVSESERERFCGVYHGRFSHLRGLRWVPDLAFEAPQSMTC